PDRTADGLRRPHQPGRFPCRQASAIRRPPGAGWRRRLQPDELERSPGIPPELRPDLAEADLGDGRPARAGERADRFLSSRARNRGRYFITNRVQGAVDDWRSLLVARLVLFDG